MPLGGVWQHGLISHFDRVAIVLTTALNVVQSLFLGRRTADVRTIGYVECFVLAKEDVLSAIRDYPEAQVKKTPKHYWGGENIQVLFSNSKK